MSVRKSIPIGTKFGQLTILGAAEVSEGKSKSIVICDCGNTKNVTDNDLKKGRINSCGHDKSTHGGSGSLEYWVWSSMIQRCTNPKNEYYKDYGGRGITVCERWLNSFENFIEDMGLKPDKKLTIERIDNNKGYYKENCKWATKSEQMSNRRPFGVSGFKGVYKHGKVFRTSIKINKKSYHIGTFKTAYIASLAYESCKAVLTSSTEETNDA